MSERILLITMPWMNPGMSCLALSTLRPILSAAGLAVDTLHGSLLYPRSDTPAFLLDLCGSFLFVPCLYPGTDRELLIEHMVKMTCAQIGMSGILTSDEREILRELGMDRPALRRLLSAEMSRAAECLDRCYARAIAADYDIIGFSATFETQLPSSLALARRLKQQRPELHIIFGGAACLEEQGDGLAASFPELAAVCHTEGEHVIVPLLRALRGEAELSSVPGIAYRDQNGQVQHNASPPLLRDLDSLPLPTYDDYLAELQSSEWRDLKPGLLFETSRGCWWGQKHLCSFCGLNAEGLAFRSKSPERALAEIRFIYQTYPQAHSLHATDNILDLKYFPTLLPALAELPRSPGRPLQIFYEIKSNLRPDQLAQLFAAGIKMVQPGIESFDDAILRLMDKGCTGLGQVQFVKWAQQEGVQAIYNLLICNPGEEADAYERMLDLLPYITHLPPPSSIVQMALERFSPYFERAEHFGIRNKQPKSYYRVLYPDPSVDLDRIAYQFDYDHAIHHDPRLRARYREFAQRVLAWIRGYQPGQLFYFDRGDHLILVDHRQSDRRDHASIEVLAGVQAELFRYLDAVRPLSRVLTRFASIEGDFLSALLERWQENRWVYRSADQHLLALVPRRYEGPRPRPHRSDPPRPSPAIAPPRLRLPLIDGA